MDEKRVVSEGNWPLGDNHSEMISKALAEGMEVSINIKSVKKDNLPHKRWVMYPGRWQPLHQGHLTIMQKTLDEGKNVWIGIRNTEVSPSNPYTAEQRFEMIKRAFGSLYGDRVIASVIPDIEGIRYSRGVGYFVEEIIVPKEISEISATNVRAGKEQRVHDGVKNYINLLESTIWLTGLPCSGKTTLSALLKQKIENAGKAYRVALLDGDDVRKGLNTDLGFTPEARKENLRRVANVAKLFNEKGNLVIASFVSPTNDLRKQIKEIIGSERFKLIYLKCPVEVCEQRDIKGMYAKARRGEIPEFTGISAPFEDPIDADLVIDTSKDDAEACVNNIIEALKI